jgi:uncharacterized protein YbcC (UPF0753/DUF2309 family)
MSRAVNTQSESPNALREQLEKVIGHAAHLLPTQGPIGVFIHHNTLHAFQHLPFEEAVIEAARKFGAEPFLPEARYQYEVRRGRIRIADIEAVLNGEADEPIWPRTLSRRELRRALIWPGLRPFSPDNIEWQIEEEGVLERLRDDLAPTVTEAIRGGSAEEESQLAHNLFSACCRRLAKKVKPQSLPPVRPAEGLKRLTGIDLDQIIHPLLIRLAAVYLDQGQSYWPMPRSAEGFYDTVRSLYGRDGIHRLLPEERYLRGLTAEFRSQSLPRLTSIDAIISILSRLGITESEWESVIEAELLALPGWAGLFHQLELDPGLAPHAPWQSTLVDFLAVRLTLTLIACDNIRQVSGQNGSAGIEWRQPAKEEQATNAEHLARVVRLYDAVQLLGLSTGQINSLSESEFQRLTTEIDLFDDFERRRILHLAYERRHEFDILAPLKTFRESINPDREQSEIGPKAQIFFCIDEREESIRRAIEEQEPGVETFGAAGFFGVAVNYRGLDDPEGVSLCPVVIKPQHAVIELPVRSDERMQEKRQQRRRLLASLLQTSFIGSRTLFRGWVGTIGFGLLSLFPLLGRTLAPRQIGRLYRWLEDRFLPTPSTELTIMRAEESGEELTDQLLTGFSINEKADRVAAVLRPVGLIRDFSRLVVILGHGSTCLNNPHESAYHCGACGGRRGGPNARLFAAMANNPLVRTRLAEMGIHIPDETRFLGGDHDTASDNITFFDEDAIPTSHLDDLRFVHRVLDAARAANALERSRRFESAWANKTPESALLHVQERAEHLAEPRPECGHATNAVAIVGRRALTRGLFLDRRSFLISYDPTTDEDGRSLAALLGAAGPVCAGINLEYYFSYVDNERYGSGTKLPHNVTSLLGVMNGQSSDLRTGLPWQMVEIHEPVRLLLIVENTPDKVLKAGFQSPLVRELIENRWIRVVTIDPDSGAFHVYRNGQFEPFTTRLEALTTVTSSPEWFLGKLDHLPIVRVAGRPGR